MPGPSRRKGRVGTDQAAARAGTGACGDSDQGILLLPPDGPGSRVVVSQRQFELALSWKSISRIGLSAAERTSAHTIVTTVLLKADPLTDCE